MKMINYVGCASVLCLALSAQAGTTHISMSGKITAGATLSASVLTIAQNSFITCESRNSGGWPAPKMAAVDAQVKIQNGNYTLEADVNSGFCEYQIKSIEIDVKPANAGVSNPLEVLVNTPFVGISGYDDIANVSAVSCQATQNSPSGEGARCAPVKSDGAESANDQIYILDSEFNNTIHLDINTQL
jgi:hypothetical protein